MEVDFAPGIEKRLADLAAQSGRDSAAAVVRQVVEEYFAELSQTRTLLDSRYDELRSGAVEPIDGEAFFESLRLREDELLQNPQR